MLWLLGLLLIVLSAVLVVAACMRASQIDQMLGD